MNKFMITEKANAQSLKADDVLWKGAKILLDAGMDIPVLVVGGGVLAAFAVGKMMKDATITKITSPEQLRQYKNCISRNWKTNVLYVEHPYMENVLIEAALYKNYILRDMVADIANYIMDHLELSKIVIGLVSAKHGESKFTVPVSNVNAEAHIKCNLSTKYMFSMKNTHINPNSKYEYTWINQFPDVIAAVEHKAGSYEVCDAVQMNLEAGINAGVLFSGAAKGEKDYEFYIAYDIM